MTSQIDNELGGFQKALSLRAYRQQVLASNIANADTPNYKARDFDFKASLQGALGGAELARTASRHLPAAGGAPEGVRLQYRTETQSSVDGNTVDMDVERAAFAENALQYEANIVFLNHLLRQIQSAIQER